MYTRRMPAPVDPRAAIRRFLSRDGERDAQARFLAELVRTPSDNPPGDCGPHAERTHALLQSLGLKAERHVVPPEAVLAAGLVSCTNLVVRERFGEGGPVVALNAHGDAVAPGAGWSVDPYGAEIRDGVMFGRGVAVSKSDFATYAWALLALREAKAPLRGAVELHFTYDEETGGEIGPAWLLAQGISRPDYVISAGFSHAVTLAHNGCLHLEVTVTGRSGHAAQPETGIDALEAATGILGGLYEYRATLAERRSATAGIGHPTLVVGLISGGINTNVVPDEVRFRLDRRILPEESPEDAERELRERITRLAFSRPGIRIAIRRVLLAQPFRPVPGQERLVRTLQDNARRVLGKAIPARGVPLYTDARHYSAAGIPTVLYGAGPESLEEANGHRADEQLRLSDLHAATEVVALTLFDLLQP